MTSGPIPGVRPSPKSGWTSCYPRAVTVAAVGRLREEMDALDIATRAIAGLLTLDEVLQLIVDRVRELAGARYAALGIVGDDGTITQFITSGVSAQERALIGPLPHGRGLLGLLIREQRSIRVDDIAVDPRRSGFPPHHPPMHSFLGVPVTLKGVSVGNLYLTEKVDGLPFDADDERVVEMFAVHAAIAIDNARLHEDVQRLAVVEERDRIGRDLHDSIIQSLYAVGLSLEDVPELMDETPEEAKARVERAIDSLHGAIGEMRDFVFGLRPELLDQVGLSTGLAAVADELRLNTRLDLHLDVDDVGRGDLPAGDAMEILQVAREALSNIARHANASAARLELRSSDDDVELRITDDGDGFEPSVAPPPGHHGLANMRDRAAALGADLSVESAAGSGTTVRLRVPLGTTSRAKEGATS